LLYTSSAVISKLLVKPDKIPAMMGMRCEGQVTLIDDVASGAIALPR